jgi:rRNA maturation endonuclease Nob1
MARCPKCKKQFKTLEDEPADHCPYCGWEPEDGEGEADA